MSDQDSLAWLPEYCEGLRFYGISLDCIGAENLAAQVNSSNPQTVPVTKMLNKFRTWQGAVLIAIGLFLTGCPHAKKPPVLVPVDWHPSLEQVREFVGKMIGQPESLNQQSLSTISQNLADIRDAQLYIAYVRLMLVLDETERRALAMEQQSWLLERDKASREAVVSKGGSLAPLEYNDVFIRMTEARLSELEKRLEGAIVNDHLQGVQP